MAAPPEVTASRLDGKYILNNKLSDSVDGILDLQGVPWLVRKAASLATPKLSVTSSTRASDGVTCIEITSAVAAKGLPVGSSNTESMTLDWSPWQNSDAILGPIEGKMGWFAAENDHQDESGIAAKFQRALVLKDGSTAGGWEEGTDSAQGKNQVHVVLESKKKGWTGDTVWGFEVVDGKRRYTRRLLFRKGSRSEMARLVYDYVGTVDT